MSERPVVREGNWACPEPKCSRINPLNKNSCESCGRQKPRTRGKVAKEIGKDAAEKSKGLFSAEDWSCCKCGNINWSRRTTCNICNAPRHGDAESRTGYGGGYMDRQDVEYKRKEDSDDEYDEFGRKKKKAAVGSKKDDSPKEAKDIHKDYHGKTEADKKEKDKLEDEEDEEEEDEEEDDEDYDVSKYKLEDDDEIEDETLSKVQRNGDKNSSPPAKRRKRSTSASSRSRSSSRSSRSSSASTSKRAGSSRSSSSSSSSSSRSASRSRSRSASRKSGRSRSRSGSGVRKGSYRDEKSSPVEQSGSKSRDRRR